MPVIAFKGWMGLVCLVILGLSNYAVTYFGQEYLEKFHVQELGATLYLAAFLCIPFAGLSMMDWRKTKTYSHTAFFIPVHFFVIALAVLGFIFRDWIPTESVPTDL
jgi:hypothetical protein